jgi:aldehyde dehydrogenase (NAD+)
MWLPLHRNSVYANGEWLKADDADVVINPATETAISEAPIASRSQVEVAIAAAREAFDHGPWPRMQVAERQSKLSAFLDAIEKRAPELISLIVAETGSPQTLAKYLQYATPMQHARAMIQTASRPAVTPLPVETAPGMGSDELILGAGVLVREPIGVVVAITPYNFPFYVNVRKIVTALVAGCTVILKPSPYTPLEAMILGDIADEVGLPKGALNIVTGGKEVGASLTSDKRVDLVTFTGSGLVGASIQAQGAATLKKMVMELGGKSAMIVRPDADLRDAAISGLTGFTVHSGQGCALLTRHIVHNSVRSSYVSELKTLAAAIKIGDPADSSITMGPLIREIARDRTENYVDIAKSAGAKLVIGGERPPHLKKGFFYAATLFDDVKNDSRIAREEVFGPIGVVIGYDTDAEAIQMANDNDYGLAGAIYTKNIGRAYEMAMEIRTGGVQINGGRGRISSHVPFGGVKRSGYGRENGVEGLNEFTTIKTINFRAG